MDKNIGDIAIAHFDNDFNCAESVLLAMMEKFGLKSELAPRMATGFGAGMARCGYACGAFTGAIIAFGILFGRDKPEDSRMNCYSKVLELEKQFVERFGSVDCIKLTGFDMRTPEGHAAAKEAGVWATKCPLFVRAAAEIAGEIAASGK
jgi:C_GCAxxG_C_C family probable redox protein